MYLTVLCVGLYIYRYGITEAVFVTSRGIVDILCILHKVCNVYNTVLCKDKYQ